MSRAVFRRSLAVLLLSLCAIALPAAARVSKRDQAAADALATRMQAAEKRYDDALVLASNNDPKAQAESDAALEDMEDVLSACAQQRGCQVSTLLATYKRLLKLKADARGDDDGEDMVGEADSNDPLDDGGDHSSPLSADVPEAERTARLLDDKRHPFDTMVEYNPAIQAAIRRWLTDMRPALIDSYENYQNLRAVMWPAWQGSGLPEALLFGIMAKESNGKTHATSRAGAAGLLQFMPATGRRFDLGMDETGFDTRFDPSSAAAAAAAYLNERMGELNNNIEFSLAGYNGGEGRAGRVYRSRPGASFWDTDMYRQFPAETQDYVPMVIAAAWLYLHPKQYGLTFPKVHPRPAVLKLARTTSIYELTICLGDAGTRDGYMRTLRNLNPRYAADAWIPAGTPLAANARIVSLYGRNCVSGPRAELAHTLVTASVESALKPVAGPQGTVAVGDPTPLVASSPAPPQAGSARKARAPRTYKVARGDTLGRIADRFGCPVRELAKANRLKAPGYAVHPGQVLKLAGCGD